MQIPDGIAIVMATFNGEHYLREQIESITRQTLKNWTLFIRDDCSSDSTLSILSEFAENDNRLTIINDDHGPQESAKKNFSLLLASVLKMGSRYVFFSDQDDIWRNDKLEIMMHEMLRFESNYPSVPMMLHSDLMVVDQTNNPLAASFLEYQGIAHENSSPLEVLLAQNFVTGCASLINRPLLEFATPIPAESPMHDWWLALCAASAGKLLFIDEALVRYRQHGNNSVGAKGYWARINPFRPGLQYRWSRSRVNYYDTLEQARALIRRINHWEPSASTTNQLESISVYASLLASSSLKRLAILRRYKIRRQGLLANLAFKLRTLLL